MSRLLLFAFALFLLVGCPARPDVDYGAMPIDAPGTFNCFQSKLTVKVVHAAGDRLNYTVGNNRAVAGPSKAAIDESAPWVIFPEAADKVWVFDGAKDVTLIEIYDDGGSKFTSSQVVPEILQRAPEKFVQRLPAEMNSKST
jgi:hypothetical protein